MQLKIEPNIKMVIEHPLYELIRRHYTVNRGKEDMAIGKSLQVRIHEAFGKKVILMVSNHKFDLI